MQIGQVVLVIPEISGMQMILEVIITAITVEIIMVIMLKKCTQIHQLQAATSNE